MVLPKSSQEDARVEYFADAKVTGNVIERGDGYIVVPILITMEDVYDYDIEGKKTGVIKEWDELQKVDNFDGTPFIAHHPKTGQTQDEIPVWGEIRNTQFDAGLHAVPSELKIFSDKAPAKFVKDAEEGKLQPISWGFAANREPKTGTFNGKKFSFADCNMTSRHVAYAPPPWTARCRKCATNTSSPIHDAEGDSMWEGEGEKTVQPDDALNMTLLPDKIDELLTIEDDYSFGRKSRVLLAQIRANLGGGSTLDATLEKPDGAKKPDGTGTVVQDAGKPEGQAAKPQEGSKEGQPNIQADATNGKPPAPAPAAQAAAPVQVDPYAKLGEMLDAKLNPVLARLDTLEGAEKARKQAVADAELSKKAEKFDASLSEAGKAENKDGKLFKAYMDADDKFTFHNEMDAKGLIAHDITPGKVQGSDALPPLGGEDAGRAQRVAEMGKRYYPGMKKEAAKGGA